MKIRSLSILLISIGITSSVCAQHYTEHQYNGSDSIFNNPERGFYKYTSRGSASGTLSQSTLEDFYNNGYTLIYRIYYMSDYVDQPISKDYLDKIREDFQIIRESGIKVVLRFAYTEKSTPPYGDATPEQVQEHVAQLKPILQENSDVIAVLQAGFIGAWGEWYYTDYFATGSPDNVTVEDLEERSDLVYSLLDALPSSRQIQLRYVGYKMDFFGEDPISPDEAYSGNAKSRMAHHNDCFLSSNNDVGTYHSAYDRTYLKSDSKYTAVGGETCRWYEPRSNCDTALVEMERYHWSFINTDYFGTTIQNWKDDGCFDDIQKKLGYRYQILSSSFQDSSRQGGSFHGTVLITNTGFSNPYNPRAVELVIRNRSTKEEYFLNLKTDIRKNILREEPFLLEFEGGIPSDAENGTYDLFLNLPDPMISLKNNPRYSIRLANENTWEASTGYNRLFHTLIINPASSAPEYTGTSFFSNSEQRNMPVYENISIDGKDDDWVNFLPAYQTTGNQHLSSAKIYNDNQYLYFLSKGASLYPNSRFFIDADNNPLTGMNFQGWQANGIDFMVENSSLYSYSGENGSSAWSWQPVDQINTVMNDSVAEIAVPLDLLDNPVDTIRYGYINGNPDFSIEEYLPAETEPLLIYKFDSFIDHAPEIFCTHYSTNSIIYWGIRENDNKSRIIERSDGDENNFKVISILSPGVIAYKDVNLSPGEPYYYRSYLTDYRIVTPPAPVVSVVTDSEIFRYSEIGIDGSDNDWNAIPPVVSLYNNSTYTLRLFTDTKNLNFLVTGNKIFGFELYIETDENPLTGTSVTAWNDEGVDYRISHDSLFYFQQGWTLKTQLSDYVLTDSVIELSIPFNEISLGNIASIGTGITIYTESGKLFLPFQGKPLAVYNRILPTGSPTGFNLAASSVDPASKIIIRWNKCSDCNGHIIEKLDEEQGSFKILTELDYKGYQYIDDNLENHKEYSYRMYSYNPAGRSGYSATLTGFTHDVGIAEQDQNERFQVLMDPASGSLILRITDPDLIVTSVALYDFSGRQVYNSSRKKTGNELTLPLHDVSPGLYLLLLNCDNARYSERVLIY
jgi:hypothetical protein